MHDAPPDSRLLALVPMVALSDHHEPRVPEVGAAQLLLRHTATNRAPASTECASPQPITQACP
eukprot:578506-Prorocentrum_minimum.AAC.1